ncbi:AAA family ATPase [Hydrogenobacter hydrogenophilus]|uniref:DNA repair protein RecN n=1 Tax=Hydrogenobacter hydrogenophilus TaxID=35835 RepID=A0A285P3T1_9AQUI|nr:AAA family ATPase [Hydrogenobacter hydrogenophilus]SNZ16380.1 DNA repair protein RecN (Recombination protein N) [Hydrogenobacter hydrogenophilus]
MLIRISLEDFFLIKDQEVEFEKGLNVITGESGTGKSLTVSSLLFLMGQQNEYPEGTAVEVEFFKDGEHIVVRREIKKGRSRYYLNGVGSVQKVVKDIVSQMVLLQGQNDRLKILRRDFQRDTYDRFSQVMELRKEYEVLYSKLEELKEKLMDWTQRQRERAIRLQILREELRDIQSVGLTAQEYENIKERLSMLSSMEKINTLVGRALSNFVEGGLIDKLLDLKKTVAQLSLYDKSLESFVRSVEGMVEELRYLERTLRTKLLDLDSQEINRLNEKVYEVQKLERRYGMNYSEILKYAKSLQSQIKSLEEEEDKSLLEEQILELTEKLKHLGQILSERRLSYKDAFESKVMETLKDIGLEKAVFKVNFISQEGRYGSEDIEFLFSSYGRDEKPLEEVASGGEVSRLALSLFLLSPSTETYVLDEIDTGISGEASVKLARLLRKLSESMQIIVITHSPAIASASHRHILTKKEFIGNMAFVRIEELKGEDRIKEIARLMGIVSEKTVESAKELIREVVYNL